jgi:hypothetical protein
MSGVGPGALLGGDGVPRPGPVADHARARWGVFAGGDPGWAGHTLGGQDVLLLRHSFLRSETILIKKWKKSYLWYCFDFFRSFI